MAKLVTACITILLNGQPISCPPAKITYDAGKLVIGSLSVIGQPPNIAPQAEYTYPVLKVRGCVAPCADKIFKSGFEEFIW